MRTRTMMIVGGAGSAFAVAAALVWTMGPAAAVGAEEQTAAAPLIASAKVSSDLTTLTVEGLNLAGDSTVPTVSLALTTLTVTASSTTSVTATLPSPIEAGTYLLLLTRGDQETASFYVTVDAGVAVWQ